jgi:chaperonin GroES
MSIRPIQDRVVVRRKEEQEVTQGGIVLPGASKEKPCQGVIVAVGPGRTLDDGKMVTVSLAVDDVVVFGKQAGKSIEIDGEELLVMTESEIYGVLN